MTFDQRHFIEQVGLFFEQAGIPRMAGRILGWLLICDPPHQSARELVEALHASTGSVSTMTRLLLKTGLLERVAVPHSRSTYYRLKDGAWTDMMHDRMQWIKSFRLLLAEGLSLLEEDTAETTRLQEAHDYYAFFEQELPALFERWEQHKRDREA